LRFAAFAALHIANRQTRPPPRSQAPEPVRKDGIRPWQLLASCALTAGLSWKSTGGLARRQEHYMMTKWIAAFAALSLAASPAMAQAERTAAPVEKADALSGGSGIAIAWIMAALAIVAAIVAATDDDDIVLPHSP
jgi:hypothetical protein